MAKRVLITGASSGIGRAAAVVLAERGWEVMGVARRGDRLAELQASHGIRPIVADVTATRDVARVRDEVESFGPLHALVNNAGGAFGLATVEHGDPADWRAMYEVNVIATQQMIASLLPSLRSGARDAGHADVVGITSVAGHEVYEKGAGYNAAKFAEHAMFAALRLELAGEPLRVIEIAPGMVRTEGFAITRFKGDRAAADAVYAGVDHPLTAEDVAGLIAYSIELPGHVNLDLVTTRPLAQAAAHKIIREPLRVRD